jgi:CheY-like chemotaxis protein
MHARPGHILIVDDDPLNRRSLRRTSTAMGHRTMDVDNGFAALTAIGTGQPDLVLLDIQMPVSTGSRCWSGSRPTRRCATSR